MNYSKLKIFKSIFYSFLILCLSGTISIARAQSVSMSISPPVIEVLIAPNKKVTQTFNLKYQGANFNIIPELHLVEPQDSSGHVNIDPKPVAPSSIPLVVTSVAHPFGEPIEASGGNLAITLTFEAPTTDVATDTYLALVLKAVGKDQLLTSSTTMPGISALILVSVNPSGVMPIDLEVQDFNPPYIHDSWLPLAMSPTLVNHVPIMIRPEGKYEVISPSGKIVLSLPLYPNLVLGNSSRSILASNQDQPPVPLSWSPSWNNIGPYRLHLTVTTLGGTKITDVEKTIWVMPIRGLTLVLIVTIMLVLYVIVLPRRKLQKSNIDNHINKN